MKKIYIDNDNLVQWTEAVNVATGVYFTNAATATFSLLKNGVAIEGADAVSMTFLDGSDGTFQGTLESTVAAGLTDGDEYTLQVDIAEDGVVGRRSPTVVAAIKGTV